MVAIDTTLQLPRLRERSTARVAIAATVPLLLVSVFAIPAERTWWRAGVAVLAFGCLWFGLQQLGRLRFGANFSLGVWMSIAWIGLIVFCAIFADLLPIDSYLKADIPRRLERPGLEWNQPLGRDINGASILSRIIYGARTSLTVVFLAVTFGLIIGSLLGLLAGYCARAVDAIINVFSTTTLSFPPLILLLSIVAVFKASVWTLAFGLAVLSVPAYMRVMRAQTISILQREFVLSARAMGATPRRIIFREILPNAILPVASYSFISASIVIVAEASLAYLGLGLPPPKPSWGTMILDGQTKLKTDPHLVFMPAIVMFLTVLSFNRIGDWARKKVLGEAKI